MKELPIIFNTEMVRAILEGRKTQTRRIVKPQPLWVGNPYVPFKTIDADPKGIIKRPYRVGDRLYVRETWYMESDEYGCCGSGLHYKADGYYNAQKWRPSIHMPKEFARIWLEVTDVRVERVQDISVRDIEAEGTPKKRGVNPKMGARYISARCLDFIDLWNFIYKNWNDNPWVWVVEFKVVRGEG